MVACRLKPLPDTPFTGRCMLGRPIGWALAAMRKALFSTERIIKLCTEAYEDHLICLPCNFFNLAAYWVCNFSPVCDYMKRKSSLKRNAYLSLHLSGEHLHHLFKFNIRWITAQPKKYLPLRIYFLILSCLIFFDLAIDTATDFLVGGPTLKAVCVDFACERLDFEEDATWTMRGCWWRMTNNNALKYTKNVHGPRGRN